MIRSWISHGFDKVTGSTRPPEAPRTDYSLSLARNNSDCVHISFFADKSVQGISLSIQGEYDGLNCVLYKEAFVPVRGELYPDPLIPCLEPFDLEAGRPLTVLAEFSAEKDCPPGDARVVIEAKSPDGEIVGAYEVRIHIWRFALPDSPSCETAIGLVLQHMLKFHHPGSESETEALYKSYYDTLLAHKMSAYTMPYDVLDPRADAYMSDPRVTTFCCDYTIGTTYHGFEDDDLVKRIGTKLASNPVWQKKAYAYPLDEPRCMDHLIRLKAQTERLQRLIPGIHQVIPFYTDIDVDSETDQVAYMAPLHDIWCPKAQLFREIYTEEQAAKFPPFPERMAEEQRKGKRVWWYVCNYPQPPYLNVFTNDPGISGRALFWQQYAYGVTGFLYWGSNSWGRLADPWADTDTFGNDIHGDGILFYPGTKIGIDGPAVSLRMKILRSGIEDFDLFTLAEKALGRKAVTERILSAVPSLVEVAADGDTFLKIRKDIGDELDRALYETLLEHDFRNEPSESGSHNPRLFANLPCKEGAD